MISIRVKPRTMEKRIPPDVRLVNSKKLMSVSICFLLSLFIVVFLFMSLVRIFLWLVFFVTNKFPIHV